MSCHWLFMLAFFWNASTDLCLIAAIQKKVTGKSRSHDILYEMQIRLRQTYNPLPADNFSKKYEDIPNKECIIITHNFKIVYISNQVWFILSSDTQDMIWYVTAEHDSNLIRNIHYFKLCVIIMHSLFWICFILCLQTYKLGLKLY
jgi:hypothetical protein